MKFNLDGFEIDIKAKRFDSKRCNREDLAAFLNRLACHEWDARNENIAHGYEAIAEANRKYAHVFGDIADELRGETA